MLTNREINKIMLHFLNKEELTIGELHHCGITDIQIYNACLTEQLLKVRSGINPFAKERLPRIFLLVRCRGLQVFARKEIFRRYYLETRLQW